MLDVRSLTKVYRTQAQETRALDDVSLTVNDGEILGLLGLNGSGKTTLIKAIAGLVVPTSGTIWLNGVQVRNPSPCVSMVAEGGRSLYWRLTVKENLTYLGSLRGASSDSIDRVLHTFDLHDIRNALVGDLSTGQKQRVAMAAGRLGTPKLVVLDEPTNGLDAVWQERCCREIEDLAKSLSIPVIVASHDLEMIGAICDRVAILDSGKMVAVRSRREVSSLFSMQSFTIKVLGRLCDSSLSWLSEHEHQVSNDGDVTTIRVTIMHSDELYGLFNCLELESLAILEVSPVCTDVAAAYRHYIRNTEVSG